MSDKMMVDCDDVVDAAQKSIVKLVREALEAGKVGKCIDTTDPEAIGELITDKGWTLYDLSIELDSIVDEDELAKAVSVSAFAREHGTDTIIEALVDNEGVDDILEETMRHADRSDVVQSALKTYGVDAVVKEVLSEVPLTYELVGEAMNARAVDIFAAIGKERVLGTLADMGWLPPATAPEPTPADRPTWEEVAAFIRGYGAK